MIEAQIAAGLFTNDSEYIRDLIRRDRERSTGFEALQAAVQEGLDSGPSDKTVPSIMEEVEARLRSDGRWRPTAAKDNQRPSEATRRPGLDP